MSFDTEVKMLALVNDTLYGLAVDVWMNDGGRQTRPAYKLRASQVFIDNYGVGDDVELSFGGTSHSGHGRERGFEALYGSTTFKTIAIRHG